MFLFWHIPNKEKLVLHFVGEHNLAIIYVCHANRLDGEINKAKLDNFLEALGDRYGQFIEDVVKKGVDVDQIERDEDKIKALETEN